MWSPSYPRAHHCQGISIPAPVKAVHSHGVPSPAGYLKNYECARSLISGSPKNSSERDFPGGPVVGNAPSNAGDTGLIPGRGTRIPHAVGQLIPRATTTELTCLKYRAHAPQLERSLRAATKGLQLRPDAAKNKISKAIL